jgi:glycosyltransferase involved in cell wall biosynthesis
LKKYLFVSHSPYINGAEICLLETVISFKRHENCDITVVLPYEKNTNLEQKLKSLDVKVISGLPNERWIDFRFSYFKFLVSTLRTFRIFKKILKSIKPDIVVINSIVTNPAYAFASRILDVKCVWYIHELADHDHGYKYMLGKKITFNLVKYLSDIQLYNSCFTLNHFSNSKNGHVLNYAVSETIKNSNLFIPLHNYKKTGIWELLIAGRTWPGKGQMDLIKAAVILKNKFKITNFHITVLGAVECEYLQKLQVETKVNQIENHVTFVPFNENTETYFLNSDIGITCSLNEAFGRITVEYLKYGLVVVGANCGGTSEILNKFEHSFLYTSQDENQLASVLYKIFSESSDILTSNCNKQIELANRIFSYENHYNEFKKVLGYL